MAPAATVSAIVVTYKEVDLTLEAIASLEAQSAKPAEILVVDNDPASSALEPVRRRHPEVRVFEEDNVGYAPACNVAAAHATGDWLFFLNPDAAADPDCLEQLLAVTRAQPHAAVVSPQVLFPDGETVNAGENQIHLTGIAWCGRYGETPEEGPARTAMITTGAAMLVRRDLYELLDGYCDEFFLFYEDPDLCWRTWTVGEEVWFAPEAHVRHHYSFGTSTSKWYYLERHRLLSVLTNYAGSTLAVLLPLLLATEAALLVVAGREGWRAEKLQAYRSVWSMRGWIRSRRRKLARLRRRSDGELLRGFRWTVDSPQIDSDVARRVAPLLSLYCSLAVGLVRVLGR